ncbi:MAG TPA: M20/M25/M40 family metallo-hydrolase [Candidatus Syntrophosphaera thermopropionivorans]|nr:M20/M25/M40 family metallo-hydrolase [Candidatus Syntrophosphaera thermopropionivorans]
MKKWVIFLATLLLASSLMALPSILAIPVQQIMNRYTALSTYEAMQQLSQQGVQILHYDSEYAIIIESDKAKDFPGALKIGDISILPDLYLVSKIPEESFSLPSSVGTILLNLRSAYLIQSSLDEIILRETIKHPFTHLGPEPIIFSDIKLLPEKRETFRTDISQIISLVDADSILYNIQCLQDFQTRFALADNRFQVAEWIKNRFISFGINDVQLQSFIWNNTDQYNVVATIPGSLYPEQYIIIGGHHDSITYGPSENPFVFAPGADDNASGSGGTLEIARVIMQSGYQPRCSIRFVTFAAEEFGLWGSKYYALTALNNNENIRLMINHDMISNNNDPYFYRVILNPYDGSENYTNYALQLIEQYTDLQVYYNYSVNPSNSDSYSFWQKGYNVLYFSEFDFSPYYHTTNDLTQHINSDYCAEVIKASTASAVRFSEIPIAPINLVVRDTGNGSSLLVTWESPYEPALDHYNLYYSTVLGQWNEPIATTQTSYRLENLTEGQMYYVGVSSVDFNGLESFIIVATGTPNLIPLTPENFKVEPVYRAVSLSWNENLELDLAGYNLYRSQSEGELGIQIGGLLTQNSFLDRDVIGSENYYYYRLCAIDQDGNRSEFTSAIKTRPVTLNKGILIVDETENMSGNNPFQPSDEQTDIFYADIMQNFETHHLDLNELSETLTLADIGIYSSILWYGNDLASMDYPYFIQDDLKKYIYYGGNLFFSVYHPTLAFALNSSYPNYFNSDTFIYQNIGISETDYSSAARFKYAIPCFEDFPPLEVDPEKTISSFNGHIYQIESIEPSPYANAIYLYGSDYDSETPQGSLNGSTVGIYNPNQNGKVIVLSFPLYNMNKTEAQKLVEYSFHHCFNEPGISTDLTGDNKILIFANYPNPFGEKTSFRIEWLNADQPVKVEVYNLRGQLVKTIYKGYSPKSLIYEWDGTDNNGKTVSSGIYSIKASQGKKNSIRKVIMIK